MYTHTHTLGCPEWKHVDITRRIITCIRIAADDGKKKLYCIHSIYNYTILSLLCECYLSRPSSKDTHFHYLANTPTTNTTTTLTTYYYMYFQYNYFTFKLLIDNANNSLLRLWNDCFLSSLNVFTSSIYDIPTQNT